MTTSQILQSPDTEKGQYDFIKGDFSAEDAQEIISHLFNKKISFHELKCFSSEIRFGKTDENSLERIIVLKNCLRAIEQQILLAKDQGKTVRISSQIHIDLV